MARGTVHPERPGQLTRLLAGIAEHDRVEGSPMRPSKAARVRVHVNAAFVRKAYRKDTVVAWSGVHMPAPIFHALDVTLFPLESMSGMLAPYRIAQVALERAEEGFYSRDICSFIRGALGAAEEAFYPTPDFFVGTTCFCDSAMKMLYNLSRRDGKNYFYIDIPAVYDDREDAVAYVADQLKALVAALEERLGRRMDIDRLREAICRSNQAREYVLKCKELRRSVPAVILGREMMDYLSPEGWGSEGMVDMYEALYEELQHRIRRNVTAVENERCRILWSSMRPYYSDDIFTYLERERGAVVVLDSVNFVVEAMDPSTPYESLACGLLDSAQYPRTGMLKQVEADISSHHIDGIILYAHWRCEKISNHAYAFTQLAERKGIPFLILDGDCVDGRDYSQEQIRTRIDAFMEIIEHRRRERESRGAEEQRSQGSVLWGDVGKQGGRALEAEMAEVDKVHEEIPYRNIEVITLREVVEQSRAQYGEHTAFQIYEDGISRSYSYEEVATIVRNVGAALVDLGVQRGDRVGLLSKNRPEWGLAYFAIVSIGAVAVPLDVDLELEELFVFLNHSEARVLFVSHRLFERIRSSRAGLPFLREIIVLDGAAPGSDAFSLEQLYQRGAGCMDGYASREVGLDDLAAILYAAGSPGSLRGAMLSHRNLVFDSLACLQVTPYWPDDRFLSLIPLYHAYEFIGGFLSPFIAGSSITYTRTMRPHKLLKVMQEVGVTKMVGVPLWFTLFCDMILDGLKRKSAYAPKAFTVKLKVVRILRMLMGIKVRQWLFRGVYRDFGGCIRYAICGGAAPDMDVLEFFDLLGIKITQGYGLTEASPVLAVNPPTRNKLRSVGVPLPGVEIKILNSNGDRGSAPLEVGEIVARGPNLMQGYYRNPEATQAILKDGWLHTGDLGYLDRDGYLYFSGRCKPVIVLQSGKNVYPEEVERVYLRSPVIQEICVLPSAPLSERGGDAKGLCGIMVPDLDGVRGAGDREAIRRRIQDEVKKLSKSMVYYRRISTIHIWEEPLPKSADGKVDREAVLKRLEAEHKITVKREGQINVLISRR